MIIGYAYVCADVLHAGHLFHLQTAKSLCDKLIVGVLTEKAILEKKKKPVLNLQERMILVKAIRYVAVVVVQDEYSPLRNVQKLRPDILFESDSHKEFPSNKILEEIDCDMKILPYYPEQSSSSIKRRIKSG